MLCRSIGRCTRIVQFCLFMPPAEFPAPRAGWSIWLMPAEGRVGLIRAQLPGESGHVASSGVRIFCAEHGTVTNNLAGAG